MKNLLFVTGFGLAVVFSNAAFAQDVKDGDKPKQEKKYNPKSNGKHNANRSFGKDRAATVQDMNGSGNQQLANKDELTKAEKESRKALKKQQKENRKLNKEAQKQNKQKTEKAE